MNSYLLDTHIFIWAMEESKRLPKDIKSKISDPNNKVFISVATAWEIIIKRMKNKLKAPKDIPGGIKTAGFRVLPIEITHVLGVEGLPLYHQDPFDRILIAQAKIEKLTLITSDKKFKKYNLSLILI